MREWKRSGWYGTGGSNLVGYGEGDSNSDWVEFSVACECGKEFFFTLLGIGLSIHRGRCAGCRGGEVFK